MTLHHDVDGLDIAIHQAAVVDLAQGVGHRGEYGDRLTAAYADRIFVHSSEATSGPST